LAQAGEFGFVLLTLAGGVNLLPAEVMQNVLAAMLISMLTAPFLIQYAEAIVRRISPSAWMDRALQIHQIAVKTMATDAHIIICGFGRSGQALSRFMSQEGIRFIALDLDPRRVHEAVAAGDSVVYGDASKREVLVAAGLMRAKTIVVTYDDKHSALKILHHVNQMRPELPVVVRTADDTYIEELKKAGAAEVVAEVTEGSVMLASQALLLSGVPLNRVIHRVQENRAGRYAVFNGYLRTARIEEDIAGDSLQSRFLSVRLNDDSVAVGRKLGELGLAELNVEVNAVRRRNVHGAQPSEDMLLQAGDILVLLGLPEELQAAESRLHSG
jgi:CPA2 family monovalent cation:H+ antiporter-2